MKYHVEKSTTINAPLTKVRPLIEDFHRWNTWSPWTIVEPDCPVQVAGTPGEKGHSMQWDGQVIGSGRNTLRGSDDKGFTYDLEFFKPWKSKAETSLKFEENGGQTRVTWTMDSKLPFFMFFMVKMMRNWIGMDYDRGLRMLKEMAEKGDVQAETLNGGLVDYEGFSYVGLQRTVAFADMPEMMKQDFEKLVNDVVVMRKKAARHWVCVYPKFNMKSMMVTYIAAVSDENLSEDMGPDYVRGSIGSGRSLEIKHNGSYEFLGNAWSMGMMFMRAQKHKGGGFPFEQYWNSPYEVKPEELKTSIYFPLK